MDKSKYEQLKILIFETTAQDVLCSDEGTNDIYDGGIFDDGSMGF
jgi:hypothetical protein